MGQYYTCDNCGLIIKDSDKKYNLLLQEITNWNQAEDKDEMMKLYNESYESTKAKVICTKCKSILDYLFNMRKKKLQQILKEIEKSYKPEKPCQCINYEDKGLVIYGKENGICYICGKRKKLEKQLSLEELKKLIEKEEGDKNEKI